MRDDDCGCDDVVDEALSARGELPGDAVSDASGEAPDDAAGARGNVLGARGDVLGARDDVEEDELDRLIRVLLTQSCCQEAPEQLRYRLIRRFSSMHTDSEGRTFYSQYEEHREN